MVESLILSSEFVVPVIALGKSTFQVIPLLGERSDGLFIVHKLALDVSFKLVIDLNLILFKVFNVDAMLFSYSSSFIT